MANPIVEVHRLRKAYGKGVAVAVAILPPAT